MPPPPTDLPPTVPPPRGSLARHRTGRSPAPTKKDGLKPKGCAPDKPAPNAPQNPFAPSDDVPQQVWNPASAKFKREKTSIPTYESMDDNAQVLEAAVHESRNWKTACLAPHSSGNHPLLEVLCMLKHIPKSRKRSDNTLIYGDQTIFNKACEAVQKLPVDHPAFITRTIAQTKGPDHNFSVPADALPLHILAQTPLWKKVEDKERLKQFYQAVCQRSRLVLDVPNSKSTTPSIQAVCQGNAELLDALLSEGAGTLVVVVKYSPLVLPLLSQSSAVLAVVLWSRTLYSTYSPLY